jgi:hypothetical protein
MFQQRDVHIPGTFNTLGGSVVTECGSKVGFNLYADTGFKPTYRSEIFRRDLGTNPCTGH